MHFDQLVKSNQMSNRKSNIGFLPKKGFYCFWYIFSTFLKINRSFDYVILLPSIQICKKNLGIVIFLIYFEESQKFE
jgi:hypothetical protein